MRASSRASSICWDWSSPIGTWLALEKQKNVHLCQATKMSMAACSLSLTTLWSSYNVTTILKKQNDEAKELGAWTIFNLWNCATNTQWLIVLCILIHMNLIDLRKHSSLQSTRPQTDSSHATNTLITTKILSSPVIAYQYHNCTVSYSCENDFILSYRYNRISDAIRTG